METESSHERCGEIVEGVREKVVSESNAEECVGFGHAERIVREWPSCHPRQGKESVAVWPGP